MFLPIESLDIKDNGKTIIHMEMVYNIIKMELNIKEVSIMVSNSAKKEDMHGQMEKYMKGHLDKDLWMDMESLKCHQIKKEHYKVIFREI